MPSPFQNPRRRHYQGGQDGRPLVWLTFLAPLGALALPWSKIVDKKLAEEVELLGVGSAFELEWGYQFALAYFILILWVFPVLFVIRGNTESKMGLLVSFLPLILLVASGSVFGTYLGPLLCLLGALALPCAMAKLHQPEGKAFSTIGSIFASPRSTEEKEKTEMGIQIDSEEVAEVEGSGSSEQEPSRLSPIKEDSPPSITEKEPNQTDSVELDSPGEPLPQKDRPEAASEEPPPLAETDSVEPPLLPT